MKTILFIINFVIAIYGSTPVFTSLENLPEERQGQVYITIDYGICLDNDRNGKISDDDSIDNYISYSGVEGVQPGDEIYTFCILNPNSNECDDIIGRIDIIAESEEISISMDNVIDYVITEYGIFLIFDDETGYYWEW